MKAPLIVPVGLVSTNLSIIMLSGMHPLTTALILIGILFTGFSRCCDPLVAWAMSLLAGSGATRTSKTLTRFVPLAEFNIE